MFFAMNGRNARPLQGENLQFHRNGGTRHRGAEQVRFSTEEPNGSLGPWEPLVFLLTSLLAVVCVAGLVTILGVLYVTVRPLSQRVYRRLAAQLGAASFLDALALLLPNTRIFLTGDSDVPSPVGTSLIISNHVVDADWWAMLMLGRCVGLRGTLKVFLRNEYLHINVANSNDQSPRRPSTGALTTSNSSSRIVASARSAESGSPTSASSTPNGSSRQNASWDMTFLAQLLHNSLEFPLINEEDHLSERAQLFNLLRSFAENNGSAVPVHLLLFPESWSVHHGADRNSIHAKSNDFAKREGRPQLKHLLLPKTRGFKASLECLRESSPVVYDVTMVRTPHISVAD